MKLPPLKEPGRKSKKPPKPRIVKVLRPKIPSYIFIHATLEKAIEVGKRVELSPLRKRFERYADATPKADDKEKSEQEKRKAAAEAILNQYVTIAHTQMQRFIDWVEKNPHELELVTAADLDLSKDDRVEVLDGDFKGMVGYLKVEPRKDSNVVMVQMEKFYFTFNVDPKLLKVIEFAKGTDHLTKKMQRAEKYVDEAMADFIVRKELVPNRVEQLRSYYMRFGETKISSETQRFRHVMILFRIYTILCMEEKRAETEQIIAEKILPRYAKKAIAAKNKKVDSTLRKYNEYVELFEETKKARRRG